MTDVFPGEYREHLAQVIDVMIPVQIQEQTRINMVEGVLTRLEEWTAANGYRVLPPRPAERPVEDRQQPEGVEVAILIPERLRGPRRPVALIDLRQRQVVKTMWGLDTAEKLAGEMTLKEKRLFVAKEIEWGIPGPDLGQVKVTV